MKKKAIQSLYVHIPFCIKKCNYCDFVSYPLKDCSELCAEYGPLLVKELVLYDREYDFSRLRTVYIGGGTPTIYPDLLSLIYYLPQPKSEFTVEANPGTVSYDQLRDMRQMGVNRLSFGVQSFNDERLAQMGRLYCLKDVKDAVYMAKEAGFANISIDMMYGLPGQSIEEWEEELEQAIALDVPHISAYALTMASGTPWADAVRRGELNVNDDIAGDMLMYTRQQLKRAGYNQYEISNFSLPGYECEHNINYWKRANYLGIGINASSCVDDYRFTNLQGKEYADALNEGHKPIASSELLTVREIISETIFLILRTDRGLNLREFKAQFGVDIMEMFSSEIIRLKALGLLIEHNGCLQLTEKALPVANQVFCRFV